MRIERHDADHRVRVPGLGEYSGNLLGETNDLWVRGRVNPKLVKLTQGRVLRASSIQQGEQARNAKRLSIFPVTRAELILLVIVLLFKAGTLNILNELVARVNPPVRSAKSGEHCTNRKDRGTARRHLRGQNIVSGRPKARTHQVSGLRRNLGQVLFDLLLLRTPRKVRVGLIESDCAQSAHHRGASKCLGKENNLRVRIVNVSDDFLPETHRLRVRVINAEDRHAVLDPHFENITNGLVDAVIVVVEVQRIDVLVLLRRILRECNRTVGAGCEPFGVFGDPRVIGGALQREVEGDFKSKL